MGLRRRKVLRFEQEPPALSSVSANIGQMGLTEVVRKLSDIAPINNTASQYCARTQLSECTSLIREICKVKDAEIIKCHVLVDHLHIFVSVHPDGDFKIDGEL